MAKFLAGVEKESRAFFINQSSSCPACRIHLNHPINLMAALIVFKSESPAVLPPGKVRKIKSIGKKSPVNVYLLFVLNQEENRLFNIERISWFGIAKSEIFRDELTY